MKARDNQISNLIRRFVPTSLPKPKIVNGELVPIVQGNVECPVCFATAESPLRLSLCNHFACRACWIRFICTQIDNFCMAQISCVVCANPLPPNLVIQLLSAAISEALLVDHDEVDDVTKCAAYYSRLIHRYDDFQIRQAVSSEPDMRWCPNGCGYGLIARSFHKCPQIVCAHPDCNGSSFCYHCQLPWFNSLVDSSSNVLPDTTHNCSVLTKPVHPNGAVGLTSLRNLLRIQQTPIPINANQVNIVIPNSANRTVTPNSLSVDSEAGSPSATDPQKIDSSVETERKVSFSSNLERQRSDSNKTTFLLKSCPKCKTLIQKCNDGSCNFMVCSLCGYEFCWLCLRGISVEHYLSFSGCTLYGRRRWSKTRQITFVIVIMLIMPILIPCVVILGIPTFTMSLTAAIARTTHDSLSSKNKHIRRLGVFGIAILSLILLCIPITVAFAILVPMALGYVYLYLPVKLLRICTAEPEVNQNLDVEKPGVHTMFSNNDNTDNNNNINGDDNNNEPIPSIDQPGDFGTLCA